MVIARAGAAEVTFTLSDAKDGKPVADAVVSLVPLDRPPAQVSPPPAPVEIVQKDQEFLPYVTAVVVGTEISFPNRDTVQHTIYSQSKAKQFTFVLYDPGKAEKLRFDKPGIVAMGCNIHDWMLAYVVVLETPWFARSAAGAAAIANVPAGRYTLEAWHPRLRKLHTEPLVVPDAASAPVAVRLTLGPDQRIPRKVERGGGGYK